MISIVHFRKIYQLILVMIVVVATGSQQLLAQKSRVENSLFWEISGKNLKRPSYLFGTYHLLNNSYLEEIPKVKAAFEKADGVVVEMVMDSSKLQQVMFALIMSEKKISELLSEEDFKLVATELQQTVGADLNSMDQFRPIFISIMLTLVYNQIENADFLAKYTGQPIDLYFASAAKSNNKSVFTFETMEEQLNILMKSEPIEEQAKQLVEFVKAKGDMMKSQKDLVAHYVNQDLHSMYGMFQKYEKQFGSPRYILDDRNVKWMETLPAMLQRGNQFIAVGALHFTGEKGLIKLLREAGYTVKPLAVK